jgi:hypothetical protein
VLFCHARGAVNNRSRDNGYPGFPPPPPPIQKQVIRSRRYRKAKATAELLAMIADVPPGAPQPRPALKTEEWLFESATEFVDALEKYFAERTRSRGRFLR